MVSHAHGVGRALHYDCLCLRYICIAKRKAGAVYEFFASASISFAVCSSFKSGVGWDTLLGMSSPPSSPKTALPHRIEVNLRNVRQLFNNMDPSPFREKDLDGDAEAFIESWAGEFPLEEPVTLVVYLAECPDPEAARATIEAAVRHHFADRGRLNKLAFRRLMQDGRRTLVTGLVFLVSCLAASQALGRQSTGTMLSIVRESLTIAGWVAMWRPMEIYLYDWWPLRRLGRIYEKLSQITVEVRQSTPEGR